jgi:2,4-dienoyl-CoA reductase-like NADH-dependent reductase (Old Yellow Enzyme family)
VDVYFMREVVSRLFGSARVGTVSLANRFVRSATLEGMSNEHGGCTDALTGLYEELARGEAGLLVTGHMYVSQEGRAAPHQLGLYDDKLIAGFRDLTNSVQNLGGKIFAQLSHGGVYGTAAGEGSPLLAASATDGAADGTVKECDEREIRHLHSSFVRAAERAYRAGFNGVQLHAAHGYLLSQFLSPHFNRREDAYGGSIENRARLLLSIVRSIRQSMGRKYPLVVKMNCSDFNEPGLKADESLRVAMMLEEAGIDAVEISGGLLTSRRRGPTRPGIDRLEKEAFFRTESSRFKNRLHIPVMLVGGIRSYETAQSLIHDDVCDFISMCRPFICEPLLVKRWKSGDTRKSRCTSDNACFRPIFRGEGICCATYGGCKAE